MVSKAAKRSRILCKQILSSNESKCEVSATNAIRKNSQEIMHQDELQDCK